MKKILLPLIVVATLLLVVTSARAGPLFDEIGALLKPLVPDEVSGAFALELRDELRECDGHILLMGSYDMVHLVGKPFYFDVWRPSPIGAGFSYKLTGTDKRYGLGYDKELDCYMIYFRQAIEIKL